MNLLLSTLLASFCLAPVPKAAEDSEAKRSAEIKRIRERVEARKKEVADKPFERALLEQDLNWAKSQAHFKIEEQKVDSLIERARAVETRALAARAFKTAEDYRRNREEHEKTRLAIWQATADLPKTLKTDPWRSDLYKLALHDSGYYQGR